MCNQESDVVTHLAHGHYDVCQNSGTRIVLAQAAGGWVIMRRLASDSSLLVLE